MRMRWLLRGERQKLNKNLKRKNSFEINIDCPFLQVRLGGVVWREGKSQERERLKDVMT